MANPQKLGPFLGENNRLQAHELATADGSYLSATRDVNISPSGRLKRRAGFTLDTALTSGDSLWCDGANIYYRDNGNLYRDGSSLGAVSGRVSYDKYPGGGVVFSDGAALKYISAAGAVSLLAPATPSSPALGATTGTLQPAKYLVAITGVDANGVESGASSYVARELTVAGGITVTLPVMPSGATSFNVYVTGPNGEVPTKHGSTSGASYNIQTYAGNQTLATANLEQMPPGDIVRVHNGRLLVASGSALYISEAYNFGLYDPSRGYILFPSTVTLVEPAQNGVYVADSDNTYWIAGTDVRNAEFLQVLPYGAIPGASAQHPTEQLVAWMTPKGLVVADQQGQVQNVQEKALALNDTGTRGAVLIDPDNSRIVAVTNG